MENITLKLKKLPMVNPNPTLMLILLVAYPYLWQLLDVSSKVDYSQQLQDAGMDLGGQGS